MKLGATLFFSFVTITGCSFDVAGTGGSPNPDRGSTETTGPTQPAPAAAPEEVPIDYEALFDAPADPTTTDDLVTGLWAGKTYYADARLKLSSDKIVIALKCDGYGATGIEIGAVVTEDKIRVLATKSNDGMATGYGCSIKVSPTVIPRCSETERDYCFEVLGTTLTFRGTALFTTTSSGSTYTSYTKLSD
jgi:hypothetical protein